MASRDTALLEGERSDVARLSLERVNEHIRARNAAIHSLETTSTPALISQALQACPSELPDVGLGLQATTDLLLDKICPALAGGQAGPRWYGLITGGVLPVAQLADQLVTSYDPVVQVHNVEETISTSLEALTLRYLMNLLSLPEDVFTSNTFTTGATASNILSLALGRNETVRRVKARQGHGLDWDVSEDGMGGVDVSVYTAAAHASIAKSASIVGIGRKSVSDVSDHQSPMPCDFDLTRLEQHLKDNSAAGRANIVVASAGEVNTGGWTSNMMSIRDLCDKYDAWLHIDAAFGAFAVLHPDFKDLVNDLGLGDSLTVDLHKAGNCPYDCGAVFSRGDALYKLCGPGYNAPAYLASTQVRLNSTSEPSAWPALDPYRTLHSPLFVNLENSRRFRALPVYASLVQLGRQGFEALVVRNISFARRVIAFLRQHPAYEVLTPEPGSGRGGFREMNIAIFAPSRAAPSRFQGEGGASELCKAINRNRVIYTTPSKWRERGAVRIAVSNWATSEEEDWAVLRSELERVMTEQD